MPFAWRKVRAATAFFLAERGHRVTLQDLSPVGLERAQALATEKGVVVQCICSDLANFDPEPQSTDLVVAIWMHLPAELRAVVHRQVVGALRPGGHFILEAYTPRQLNHSSGGPPSAALLIEPDQLRDELQGLDLLMLQECERWIDEGQYHHGQSAVVQALGRKPDPQLNP